MEEEAAGFTAERDATNDEMLVNDGQIEEMKNILRARRAEVRDKDRIIGELAEQVDIRDGEIDRLQAILADKDAMVGQLEDQMRHYGVASAQ